MPVNGGAGGREVPANKIRRRLARDADRDVGLTVREIGERTASVHRTLPDTAPIRLLVRVPHAGRGAAAWSQARWRRR
ncbi:MAG TPA: hypothetical protein VM753_02800 [Anaeromyxobacter sp.]|nr:hypothetical protein [Anaeromyxobacter sp.]